MNAEPRAEILAYGRNHSNEGATRSALMGRTPSDTEYCPASSLETICAASRGPVGAATSSAVVKATMATFGSFISLRAFVLLLPLGRRSFGRWSATRGLT